MGLLFFATSSPISVFISAWMSLFVSPLIWMVDSAVSIAFPFLKSKNPTKLVHLWLAHFVQNFGCSALWLKVTLSVSCDNMISVEQTFIHSRKVILNNWWLSALFIPYNIYGTITDAANDARINMLTSQTSFPMTWTRTYLLMSSRWPTNVSSF